MIKVVVNTFVIDLVINVANKNASAVSSPKKSTVLKREKLYTQPGKPTRFNRTF